MRHETTALALLVCTLAACSDEPAASPPALRNPLPADESAGPIDALSRRYGRLRQRMAERGYEQELGMSRLFLLEEEGRVLPLDLDGDQCTTLLAIAGGSIRELAMSAHDGEGDEVATDLVQGEGGLVHVCPQAAEPVATLPHYLVLRASEGSGSVILSAYASELGSGEGFAGLFDGVLAPQVRFRSVEEQLARSRTALRDRGLLPVAEPRLESLAEGEGMRVPVTMESDRCYVVIARGGDGVRDVDLVLFDAAGAELARDLESDAEPGLELCGEPPGELVIEASAYEGAGAVGVLVLAGPIPSDAAAETAPAAALEPTGETDPAEQSDPVTNLMSLANGLTARGYGSPSVLVADGYIAPGEVRAHDAVVGPGCSVVIGMARSDTDLDLYLSDGAGRALDRDTGIQPVARVSACTTEPEVITVTVKAYGRRSAYALAMLRAPETIRDVQTLRLEEAVAGLRGRGYAPVDTLSQTLDAGDRFDRTISIRPDTCTAIAAAGDVGVEDLDVLLHDIGGDLLATSSGPEPYATVNRCAAAEGETIQFSVVMYRGAGAVQITRLEGAP
jgi:hypothetical protein